MKILGGMQNKSLKHQITKILKDLYGREKQDRFNKDELSSEIMKEFSGLKR